jgi:Protein of unknown function (DUF2934)
MCKTGASVVPRDHILRLPRTLSWIARWNGTHAVEATPMTALSATPATDEEISLIAYEIWESEGRPDGRDQEHWFLAKELVAGGEGETSDTVAPSDPHGSASARPDATGDDPGNDGARQIDEEKHHTYVRPAGPKKMDNPPSTWSKTDEEVDESFPASDPPGNY